MNRFLVVCLLFSSLLARAQSYHDQLRNRAVFWSEINLIYKVSGKWSFQLDHQYRRQADDNNGRDLNIFRHPLLQVFRPWINYQLSPSSRLSLSPLGFWWNWDRVNADQPITFFQEIRVIPQYQLTKPVVDGEWIQRFRTELRWASSTDTLAREYVFLADGESQPVRADRFSIRLRAMARWINPVFKHAPNHDRWYSHLSVEPMLVGSATGVRFDQLRTYLALGRKIQQHVRLEIGYMNQFTSQRIDADQIRLFRFNHGLHVYIYLENR